MAETAGSIIDKICIMELKIFHMFEQSKRTDVSRIHGRESAAKLKILKRQTRDLEEELAVLLKDLISGKEKLKLYRQFKMYNDPKYRLKNG